MKLPRGAHGGLSSVDRCTEAKNTFSTATALLPRHKHNHKCSSDESPLPPPAWGAAAPPPRYKNQAPLPGSRRGGLPPPAGGLRLPAGRACTLRSAREGILRGREGGWDTSRPASPAQPSCPNRTLPTHLLLSTDRSRGCSRLCCGFPAPWARSSARPPAPVVRGRGNSLHILHKDAQQHCSRKAT